MTSLSIILGVSLAGIVVLLGNRLLQLQTGRAIFSFSFERSDSWLRRVGLWFHSLAKYFSAHSLKAAGQRILTTIEVFFIKGFVAFHKLIGRISRLIKGPRIPHNRGSVSFFIKHIEDHKSRQKAPNQLYF
ncbi:MAG: hypothetical protein PHF79_03290 [Candidatus Pacebacteria bacterium]|nr:hypothetical protein [Candidatus Paceibacterota bacterium]